MKKIILVLCCFLAGCAYRHPLADFRFQTEPAGSYVVASWSKVEAPGQPVKIYIEGDGEALNADGRPAGDPTPRNLFWRKIAGADPSPNVVYLARPCQFIPAGACAPTDWTSGRFSPKIIDAMDAAVRQAMKKARTDQVVLLGYDGGAQVAGLIAVRHPAGVRKLITVAGVLDHKAWTSHHGYKPLSHSLNLADKRAQLAPIPQIHYVGGRDDVAPPALAQAVADEKTIVVVPRATHSAGFDKIIPALYRER